MPKVVAIVLFCIGTAIGFAARPLLDDQAHQTALRFAAQVGGILYFVDFGRSLLVAWAAWALWSVAGAGAFALRVSSADRASDDRRTIAVMTKRFAVGAATLSAVFLIALAADFNSYAVFTPEAYVSRSFPSQGGPAYMWSDARTVRLGCKHTPDTYRTFGRDDLIYRVRFANGATVRVDGATPLNGKFDDWLGQLDLIDAALRKSNAAFVRWETPLDNRCVAAYYRALDPADFKRFTKILRIGAFPFDPRV